MKQLASSTTSTTATTTTTGTTSASTGMSSISKLNTLNKNNKLNNRIYQIYNQNHDEQKPKNNNYFKNEDKKLTDSDTALSSPLSSSSTCSSSSSSQYNTLSSFKNLTINKTIKKENTKYAIANKVELIDLNNNTNSNSKSSNSNLNSTFSNSYLNSNKISTIKNNSLSSAELIKVTNNCLLLVEKNQIRPLDISFEQLIMNNSNSASSLADPNKIHLFVKAGQDGRSQGACPFCQAVFLQLLIKAQTNKFNFDVITINMDNPPKEFKELSIKPPVLIHGSSKLLGQNNNNLDDASSQTQAIILSDVDEIAEYLDNLYPNSRLVVNNPEAKKVCLNVFSKFSFFIRDVASNSASLEIELEKIDNYLRENTSDNEGNLKNNKTFLNGKQMTLLDCSLLPKLQHIRVASEAIKQFKIPYKFKCLWKYIQNAYQTDAFQKSCPPDREIIWNWSKTFLTQRDLLQIIQEAPVKTLGIPDDLVI